VDCDTTHKLGFDSVELWTVIQLTNWGLIQWSFEVEEETVDVHGAPA